jgi:hypothetical protein
MAFSTVRPFGVVRVSKTEKIPTKSLSFKELLYWTFPRMELYQQDREVFWWRMRNWPQMWLQIVQLTALRRTARWAGSQVVHGKLFLTHLHGKTGREQVLGLVSLKAVTDVFVNDVVDEMDEATDDASLKLYNYHGIGTGTTAADATDTDLETELTTEYNPNSTRATGAQTQPSANIYQTLATNTLDSGTPAVTEQGVLTSATVGSGTLCDRHTFAAKNLDGSAGDGLQSQYQMTVSSGG